MTNGSGAPAPQQPPAPPAPPAQPPRRGRRPNTGPGAAPQRPRQPSALARWVDRLVKSLAGMTPLDWGKLAMKLIVSFRYAVDTFTTSYATGVAVDPTNTSWAIFIALINVVVIDVAFTLMWFIASSHPPAPKNGQPQQDQLAGMRVPAAFIAWGLFAAMLVLAGDAARAGGDATLVARVTGGAMLAYDTYGMLGSTIGSMLQRRRENAERRRAERDGETIDQRRVRVRQSMWKTAYAAVASTLGVLMTAWYSVGRVRGDILEDRDVMEWHVQRAQEQRRAKEGVDLKGGAHFDPEEFMVVGGAGTEWTWECRACGEHSAKAYKTEGTARSLWKQHAKKDIPQHAILRPKE